MIFGYFWIFLALNTPGFEKNINFQTTLDQQEIFAFLGIEYVPVSKKKAITLGFHNYFGCYVTRVIPGTGAFLAGIKPFDYIYGVDHYRVSEMMNLGSILSKYATGDQAILHYIRNSKPDSSKITFLQKELTRYAPADKCDEPFLGVRQNLESPIEKGVKIEVVKNSTAMDMGLKDSDIILQINGYPMLDWDDIRTAVSNSLVGEPIAVTFVRGSKITTFTSNLKSYCDTHLIPPSDAQTPKGNFNYPYFFKIETIHPIIIEDINEKLHLKLPEKNSLDVKNVEIIWKDSEAQLSFYLDGSGSISIQLFDHEGLTVFDYLKSNFQGSFFETINLKIEENSQENLFYLLIKQNDKHAVFIVKVD